MANATFNPSTKDKPGELLDKAKDAGNDMADKAKGMAGDMADKAKGMAGDMADKAKGVASSIGDMASDTATNAGRKADDLTAAAGHEIREFGETIGKKAPQEGIAGRASQAVAETFRGTGQYIEEHKLSGMAKDVEQMVKSHPLPALLICLGVGFCIGRAMKD